MGTSLISENDIRITMDGEGMSVSIFQVDPLGVFVVADENQYGTIDAFDVYKAFKEIAVWAYNLGFEKAKESL
jgi:hypothetical protein